MAPRLHWRGHDIHPRPHPMSPIRRTSARAVLRRARPLVLAPLLGACALLGRGDPPVDRTEDPRIRREVEARLAQEPALAAGAIRVEVEGRVVLLHGTVPGLAAWQCAIANAELVEGVQTVVDYLVIERGPREIRCLAPREQPASSR